MFVRRVATRLISKGPYRIRYFDDIAGYDAADAMEIHKPEEFRGILALNHGDTALYKEEGMSLLQQRPTGEIIRSAPKYCTHSAVQA
jgi:hypothetical protein